MVVPYLNNWNGEKNIIFSYVRHIIFISMYKYIFPVLELFLKSTSIFQPWLSYAPLSFWKVSTLKINYLILLLLLFENKCMYRYICVCPFFNIIFLCWADFENQYDPICWFFSVISCAVGGLFIKFLPPCFPHLTFCLQ